MRLRRLGLDLLDVAAANRNAPRLHGLRHFPPVQPCADYVQVKSATSGNGLLKIELVGVRSSEPEQSRRDEGGHMVTHAEPRGVARVVTALQ